MQVTLDVPAKAVPYLQAATDHYNATGLPLGATPLTMKQWAAQLIKTAAIEVALRTFRETGTATELARLETEIAIT